MFNITSISRALLAGLILFVVFTYSMYYYHDLTLTDPAIIRSFVASAAEDVIFLVVSAHCSSLHLTLSTKTSIIGFQTCSPAEALRQQSKQLPASGQNNWRSTAQKLMVNPTGNCAVQIFLTKIRKRFSSYPHMFHFDIRYTSTWYSNRLTGKVSRCCA